MVDLVADLRWRGLIYDTTGKEIEAALDRDRLTLYWGVDPTAKSMHVGQLLGLIFMRRLQAAGHKPVLLAGGSTGMIGDPSFKATERKLLTTDVIAENMTGIETQLRQFVDFDCGDNSAVMVNNLDWTKGVGIIDFLREVGKHFTINQMISRESVRARLQDREQGISFTEFSYSLLQAFDYLHLYRAQNCGLQVGGSDQWGNILSGVELVRRSEGAQVHAMCWPLVTKADGTKFGKSEAGTVWLDPQMTSPYQFHQFFQRVDDASVGRYLRYFTMLAHEEIEQLDSATETEPHARKAQRRLADELTTIVHGEEQTRRVTTAARLLFEGGIAEMDESMLIEVLAEVPSLDAPRDDLGSVSASEWLVRLGLTPSKSAARTAVNQGGVTVNGQRLGSPDEPLERLLHDRYVVIRRGKKDYGLVRFG